MSAVDVLIAGAGPVGLYLATELRRRGRSCAILERNAGPSVHSKALGVMPRTLEIFEISGLAQRLVARGNPIRSCIVATPRASARVTFDHLPPPYAFVLIVPQSETEALLVERLRELETEVRYGAALEMFDDDGDAVHARVRTASGLVEEIHARYLVGCDGAHSRVRDELGIAFDGDEYPEGAMLADVRVETSVPDSQARLYVARDGTLTLFPMPKGLRRVVIVSPNGGLPGALTRAWLQAQLDARAIPARIDGDPVWTSAFRVHRRVAAQMRKGNVFLAGDAAHIHSPAGGQGMNTGLQDAANLAWKLVAVLRGTAPETLLGSYEAERLPVARAVLRETDALTHALANPNPLMQLARELAVPLLARLGRVQRAFTRRLSELDLAYTKSPIVRGSGKREPNVSYGSATLYERLREGFVVLAHGEHAQEAVTDYAPVVTAQIAPAVTLVARVERGCAVRLIRPDGYVAYEARAQQWSAAFGELVAWMREAGLTV